MTNVQKNPAAFNNYMFLTYYMGSLISHGISTGFGKIDGIFGIPVGLIFLMIWSIISLPAGLFSSIFFLIISLHNFNILENPKAYLGFVLAITALFSFLSILISFRLRNRSFGFIVFLRLFSAFVLGSSCNYIALLAMPHG